MRLTLEELIRARHAIKRIACPTELYYWIDLPENLDMVPYGPWYQRFTKAVASRNPSHVPTVVVEAGVRFGCSARIFADILRSFDNWQLHLIDPVLTAVALEVGEAFPDHVSFYDSQAELVADHFADGSIDLLHIDADFDCTHPYEIAFQILQSFLPKLKSSGIVIFHDCTPQFPGILRLVGELEESGWAVERAQPMEECPISAPAAVWRENDSVIAPFPFGNHHGEWRWKPLQEPAKGTGLG